MRIRPFIALFLCLAAFSLQAATELPARTIPEILSGKYDYAPATFTGIVQDVLADETDPAYNFMVVRNGENVILVSIGRVKGCHPELLKLIGATVSFTGFCECFIQVGKRQHMGRRFSVRSPTDIKVINPPPDIFAASDLLALDTTRPNEIAQMPRHKTYGRVLAVWGGDKVLVLTPSNRLTRIDLADPHPPRYDDFIEAVGYPETDLYHLNLSRAVWRPATAMNPPPENVQPSSLQELLEGPSGTPIFQKELYGKTLRLSGTVRRMPDGGILQLEDDPHILPIDVSALERLPDGLAPNCRVEVTGSCIMDVDNWRPHAQFPKIRGITLVTRTADDIRITARPPWWTAGRLLAVICALLAVLLGILVWNRALHALAERRGRELYREQIQSVRSELKFRERTDLAVELHDALSQYLTGIAFELRSIGGATDALPENARRHLNVASHTLASCRDELRNCLWDLRHNTLDQRDVEEAIRMTVTPHVGETRLLVRFPVPRNRFTDNTIHAVLQIVRELATNAVRHGEAGEIRIAGALDGRMLRFSVRDNGRGFDPESAPGMEQGHFGLLGVQERIDRLDGTLEIDSAPGRGTRISASIPLQKETT